MHALVLLLILAFAVLVVPACLLVRVRHDGQAADLAVLAGPALGAVGLGVVWREHAWRPALVVARRLLVGRPIARKARKPRRKPAPAPHEPAAAGRRTRWERIALTPLTRFLRSLPRAVSVRRVTARGVFGLQDPCDTGRAAGYLEAARAWPCRRVRLSLTPDFVSAGFRGEACAALHLHLGLILLYVLRLAASVGSRWLRERWQQRRSRRAVALSRPS